LIFCIFSLVFDFSGLTADRVDCSGSTTRNIPFSANETSKNVTACRVVDDREVEGDETFRVNISGVAPSIVNASRNSKTIKLISNDGK
jgi:hypothetical protein